MRMRDLSVLVVGDARSVAEALTVACRRDRRLLILGPVPDAIAAVTAVAAAAPDLLVVDLDRTDGLGIDVVSRVRELVPAVRALATTLTPSPAVTAAVLSCGGIGLLSRPFAAAQVRDVVERSLAGELILPADDLAAVMAHLDQARWRSAETTRIESLTNREREILALLAGGLGTAEIASSLGITTLTVQSHVKNILAKLAVHSKVEAVRMAWRCRAVAVPA
jgi:DNA-binding NarL/FixJ family response regulator